MVVASADFKAKELVLVAGAQSVSKKATTTSISIGMHKINDSDVELFLPPSGINLKSGYVSPFWSVQQAAEPNLVLNFKEIDIGDVKVRVPILVNQKKVRKGDVLTWCKDAAVSGPPPKKPKTFQKTAKKRRTRPKSPKASLSQICPSVLWELRASPKHFNAQHNNDVAKKSMSEV